MERRIEAVTRALFAMYDLDPHAVVTMPDHSGELRSGDHSDGPQWRIASREAARFLAVLEAAMPPSLVTLGLLPPGRQGDTMAA